MGEYKKAEQFFNMIKSSTHPAINEASQLYLTAARMMQIKRDNPDDISNMLILMHEFQKNYQSIANCELAPDLFREINKFQAQFIAALLDTINSTDIGSLNKSMLLKIYNEMLEKLQRDGPEFATPSIHPSLSKPARLFSEIAKSSDEQMKSTAYDTLKFDIDNFVFKENSSRSFTLLRMAMTAESDGDYDRAIALVRDGLSVTCDYDTHVMLYEYLIIIYKKQKNWPAVIKSCQCIIDMPQIPPSSSTIVEAHIERGNACIELDDLSEALISYTKALELQSQHHVPNHPLTSEIHIKIGNVFKKRKDVSAALESYGKAITLGFPDTASEAYEMIGSIYTHQRNYDVARSNFIKCLEIQEGSIPQKTFRLACTHIWLALVEHKTEHYQQRDFHFQQAITITDHDDEEIRDLVTKQISQILGEVTPTTS
jgi:tetratricopeptide (TPR) repeat protein